MSIAPLNITGSGDAGTTYALPQGASRPDPVVSTVASTATPESRRSSESDITEAVGKLNDFAAASVSALNFTRDEETGRTVVKVVDTATDTVIRQIPNEEAIAIAKSIDKMQGLLFNHKA